MKKIAYIELNTHAEIAHHFMKLMSESECFEVDYYFSEKIIRQLEVSENHQIIKVSHQNLLSKLSEKNYSFIIIGTAHRYFNLFEKIIDKTPTYIITHNLNFSKISPFNLIKNTLKKDVIFRIKLWLKEGLLKVPNVYKKAKGLLVLDENLSSHQYQFLPIFYKEFDSKNRDDIFRIIIPGAVSQKRRDYRFLLAQLEYFTSKMEIVFLGKAEGEELNWLKSFKNEYLNLIYFTEKIPQSIFNEWMNKADLLWCPIQKETEFFSQKEIYGFTKMTGNIGDAIKYGLSAIFPAEYQHYPFVIVQNNDIETLIKNHNNDFDFDKMYSKESVSKRLHKILDDLYCQ